jgi:aldehyde dehydrogenase (NAD+)
MKAFTVGDPADPKTAIGPMVSAVLLAGGEGHPAGLEAGYFVKPTVFANVRNDMTIAQEEIFGPVLCVIAYDSEDEAIRLANDSKYGLHAAVIKYSGADREYGRYGIEAFLETRAILEA